MPTHTRPTTPRIRPTIRRSCARQSLPLRRQGDLAPCKRGSPEGESPSGKGSGGCAPSFQELVQGMAGWKSLGGSAAGWVGPTNGAMPTQPSPCRLQAEGAGLALPGYNLFPFVGFGPSCTEALGLRSARALADTTCSPFSTVSTPPSGALGPSSTPCLADTTRLPLSTCPPRLNPKLRGVPPSSGSRKNAFRQFNANRLLPSPARSTPTTRSPTARLL